MSRRSFTRRKNSHSYESVPTWDGNEEVLGQGEVVEGERAIKTVEDVHSPSPPTTEKYYVVQKPKEELVLTLGVPEGDKEMLKGAGGVEVKGNRSKVERFECLDGLRGFACVVVLFFHWGAMTLLIWKGLLNEWGNWNPIQMFFHGTFCVRVFFILSGFVLSYPVFVSYHKAISRGSLHDMQALLLRCSRMAIGRIFRLGLPVLFSIILVWMFTYLDVTMYCSRGVIKHLKKLSQDNIKSRISFFELFEGYLYRMWTQSKDLRSDGVTNDSNKYFRMNDVLWTIPVELRGTFLVLLLSLVMCVVKKYHIGVYLGALYLLSWDYVIYQPFVFGVMMAQSYHQGHVAKCRVFFQRSRSAQALGGVSFLVIWHIVGSSGIFNGANSIPARCIEASGLPFNPDVTSTNLQILLACVVVVLVLACPPLTYLFNTPLAQFMGRISFSLYLIHMPLLYLIFNPIVTHLNSFAGLSWEASMYFALPPYFLATILLAWVFHNGVERHTPKMSKYVSSIFLEE
eukprot:Nk52_evm37s212 gene=Nk52_evmTU37s212